MGRKMRIIIGCLALLLFGSQPSFANQPSAWDQVHQVARTFQMYLPDFLSGFREHAANINLSTQAVVLLTFLTRTLPFYQDILPDRAAENRIDLTFPDLNYDSLKQVFNVLKHGSQEDHTPMQKIYPSPAKPQVSTPLPLISQPDVKQTFSDNKAPQTIFIHVPDHRRDEGPLLFEPQPPRHQEMSESCNGPLTRFGPGKFTGSLRGPRMLLVGQEGKFTLKGKTIVELQYYYQCPDEYIIYHTEQVEYIEEHEFAIRYNDPGEKRLVFTFVNALGEKVVWDQNVTISVVGTSASSTQ